jgi:hypothetical protein
MAWPTAFTVTGNKGTSSSTGNYATNAFAVTQGDVILVMRKWEGSDTTVTCTDNSGNTYTSLLGGDHGSGSEPFIEILYAVAKENNASLIATTAMGASRPWDDLLWATVRPDAAGTVAIDVTGVAAGGLGTSIASGNITTNTQDTNCLLLIGGYGEYGATLNSKTLMGTTPDASFNGGVATRSNLSIRRTTSGATGQFSGTISYSEHWACAIGALKITAAGGTDVTVNAAVQALTFSVPASTVTAVRNASVAPAVQSVVASLPAATAKVDCAISPAVQVVAASLAAVTIVTGALISPAVQAASLSIPATTVTAIRNVSTAPAAQTLAFSIPAATATGGASSSPAVQAVTASIPAVTVVEPFSSLTDDFDDNSLDTDAWNNWGGSNVVEQNQRLELSTTASSTNYYGMEGKVRYDLTNSFARVEVLDAGNQSLTSFQFFPLIAEIDQDNRLDFQITGGVLYAQKTVATTVSSDLAHATFNATTHRYLRIREASGTTYWEYSGDGSNWTSLYSEATPIDVTRLRAAFIVGTWQAEASATTGIVDNFNIVLSGVTITPAVQVLTGSIPAASVTAIQNVTVSAAVQTVTASIPAVSIDTSSGVTINAAVQTLTFSQPAAQATTSISVAPATQALTVSAPARTVTAIQNVTVSAGVEALTASIPAPATTTSVVISPAAQNLTSSVPTPTVTAIQNVTVSPGVLAATLSQPSATVTAVQNATISPAAQTATFSLPSPTVVVPQPAAPAANSGVYGGFAYGTLAYGGVMQSENGASVAANVQALSFSLPAPTVTAVRNATLTPAAQSLTASVPTATIAISVTVTPSTQTAVFSQPAVAVNGSQTVTVNAAVQALTSSLPTPTVTAQISVTVSAATLSATFSTQGATVSLISNASIQPEPVTLTFSIPRFSVLSDKYAPQNTSAADKYSERGTSAGDKYSTRNTSPSDKFSDRGTSPDDKYSTRGTTSINKYS